MAGAVSAEIDQATTDERVRLAMKLGALLEGGSLGGGPFPEGDSGTSFGPFQIHLPAHPGVSAGQAQDPSWAVRYMLGEYRAAVASVSDSLWSSDPKSAAALAAFRAERPAVMYPADRIDRAWRALKTGALGGIAAGLGKVADFASDPAGAVKGAVASAFQEATRPLVTGARNVAVTGAFLALGLALVGMGAWRAVGPTVKRAARAGASAAKVAAV